MLYKVKVGRDEYLGTAEEVVLWMSKAAGAPKGGPRAYMKGIRARLAERGSEEAIDASDATAFLESLAKAGLLDLEEKREASPERWDPAEILDEGPVAFGDDVAVEDLELDVFRPLDRKRRADTEGAPGDGEG